MGVWEYNCSEGMLLEKGRVLLSESHCVKFVIKSSTKFVFLEPIGRLLLSE